MAERRLGLHIQPDTIRAVEIEQNNRSVTLCGFAEARIDAPLPRWLDTLGEEDRSEYLQAFSDSLKSMLKNANMKSRSVSLAIDIRHAFILTMPFDGDFSEENLRGLIRWELTNYFPGLDGASFLYDTYNPGYNPSRDVSPEIIFTAVLKPYIHMLQEGIKAANLQIRSINVDQFTIENVLRLDAGNLSRERLFAVCFLSDETLYCSLLWNNRLIRYREYAIPNPTVIPRILNLFITSASLSTKNTERRIYVYPYETDVPRFSQIAPQWKMERFSPFSQLKKKWRVKRMLDRQPVAEDAFTPAVGAAIGR